MRELGRLATAANDNLKTEFEQCADLRYASALIRHAAAASCHSAAAPLALPSDWLPVPI
ncbi:MAG: hypothetical protein JWM27_4758 [Gemmatimonadetes bacterium]|nr:hypothetical protein [Gemmatimonadota bacterium]